MKKIFLYAYDKQNLGDDLFVHTITARYPQVRFYLRSDEQNKRTFACLPNLKIIDPKPRLARLLGALRPSFGQRYLHWQEKRCDASVYIGGSIFMEYPQWRNLSQWWDYQAKNRTFFVLGANFGPYHDPQYPAVMGKIFADMADVCFRDRFSYDLFSHIPTVRQAPDILFAHPMPKVAVKEKQILVSVINCAARDEAHNLTAFHQDYIRNLAALLGQYLADGCSIVLTSFCRSEGDEDGIAAVLEAMGSIHDPRIRTLCYDGTNAHAITAAIAESDYVIATRFHAAVLAMAAGRPVLPILYSDKTKHLLQDLGFEGVSFDLRQAGHWDYARSRQNWEQPLPPLPADIKQVCAAHFEKLDQLLTGR